MLCFFRICWLSLLGLLALGPLVAQPMELDEGFAPEVEKGQSAVASAGYAPSPDGHLFVFGPSVPLYANDVRYVHGLARIRADGTLDASFTARLRDGETVSEVLGSPDGGALIAASTFGYMAAGSGRIVRLLATGEIDPTFSSPFSYSPGLVVKLNRRSDGSVLAWGEGIDVGQGQRRGVARMLADGAADLEYGATFADTYLIVTSLAVAPDDRAVFAGAIHSNDGPKRYVFHRLTPAGAIDPSFSPPPATAECTILAVLPDHRVLVWDEGFHRLNVDGSTDSSFAPQLPAVRRVRRAAVLADERLAVEAVTSSSDADAVSSIFILQPDGTLDIDCRDLPGGERIQKLCALRSDGKIAIAQGPLVRQPETNEPAMAEPALCIIDPAGRTLTTLSTTVYRTWPGTVTRVASDPAGRILVEGDFTHIAGQRRAGYARFDVDGTLDPTFQPPAVTPLFNLPDGAMIASRATLAPADASGFHLYATRLVRLTANGTLDPTFTPAEDIDLLHAKWLTSAPDGRMLVFAFEGGVAVEQNARLVWLDAHGRRSTTLATTFAGFDTPVEVPTSLNNTVNSAVLLPDGKLLIPVEAATVNGAPAPYLVRLNPDGSTDPSYCPADPGYGTPAFGIPLPDGRAYAYSRNDASGASFPVVRLNADGSIDRVVARALANATRLADGSYFTPYAWQRFHADGTLDLNFTLRRPDGYYFSSAALAGDGSIWLGSPWSGYREPFRSLLRRLVPAEVDGFTVQPKSQQAIFGTDVIFETELGTAAAAAFQWTHDGVPIPGANDRILRLVTPGSSAAGEYRLIAIVGDQTYTSEPATLTVTPSTARLVNFSARCAVSPAYPPQIGGFVLRGNVPRPVLLRAVGRGLPIDHPEFALLPEPVLTLHHEAAVLARDAGGALAPAIADKGRELGAFALRPATAANEPARDSALLQPLQPGVYTAHSTSADGRAGVGLFEFYDAEPASPVPAVVNVSIRGRAAPGNDVLIAGFVIGGEGGLRVLIRGLGPALGAFGVDGVVADPQITLFRENTPVATNDDWADRADLDELVALADRAGVHPLSHDSRDAAIMTVLQPGVYTVHGRGADNGAGEMLIEVFVLEN